jgi:hypothetical protein
MHKFRRLAVAAAGMGLLLAPLLGTTAASAGTHSSVWLMGGTTTVTTGPGIAPSTPLGGTIDHRGGILFADYKTGKHVEVSNFVIDLSHGDLTGIVNGNPKTRTALFTLSLAHAKLAAGRLSLKATGITVDLTAGAAAALNSALGTTLFSGGPDLGTAATSVCF